jgi:hypothetical protein
MEYSFQFNSALVLFFPSLGIFLLCYLYTYLLAYTPSMHTVKFELLLKGCYCTFLGGGGYIGDPYGLIVEVKS